MGLTRELPLVAITGPENWRLRPFSSIPGTDRAGIFGNGRTGNRRVRGITVKLTVRRIYGFRTVFFDFRRVAARNLSSSEKLE
ncbi:MAG: hypothetical protein GY866_24280 [Proteobacteria bacterium]|nr:hypothetical protein [Pseudomonadota bacterium]